MILRDREKDTICALCSGMGRSAVALIRVSGERAKDIVSQHCSVFRSDKIVSRKAYLTSFCNSGGEVVDEVLATWFEDGKSYTGQSTLEITCHGNPVIVQEILRLLVQSGARPAEPGEFTFRAFMNGKIDLAQAEGVLEVIESRTLKRSRRALRNVRGLLSYELNQIEEELISILSECEAMIDFSEEGLGFSSEPILKNRIEKLRAQVATLADDYVESETRSGSFEIGIMGPANVGKSSLFNALLKEDRAIVTTVAGTTRDIVEADWQSRLGVAVMFDSAGIRESEDPIEREGIKRGLKRVIASDAVLLVFDGQEDKLAWKKILENLSALPSDVEILLILNKCDLRPPEENKRVSIEIAEVFKERQGVVGLVEVSVLNGTGIEAIKEQLLKWQQESTEDEERPLLSARQYDLLSKTRLALQGALTLESMHLNPDLLASELGRALSGVQELLGKKWDDVVMDRVFRDFCIGK